MRVAGRRKGRMKEIYEKMNKRYKDIGSFVIQN